MCHDSNKQKMNSIPYSIEMLTTKRYKNKDKEIQTGGVTPISTTKSKISL